MISYTAYHRPTGHVITERFPCLADALTQAAHDASDPAGAVLPFSIITPHRYLARPHILQLVALWRDLTPHMPTTSYAYTSPTSTHLKNYNNGQSS